MEKLSPQTSRLFKKVRSGKAVLFIGAGASQGAGIPGGAELARLVHSEFIPDQPKSDDLIQVCTDVLDTPGIDRVAVEDFLRKHLNVQPSPAHMLLPRNKWQAVFTTNFDDLVETAYRTTAKPAQRCEPTFSTDFSRRQSDYFEVVRLFKLMGCVKGSSEDSRMALTRSDYNRKLRRRGSLFQLLFDFVKDGTIVYIGYSFQDKIARDVLYEVIDEVGVERLPWGWAILPDWDQNTETFLQQRRVQPLKSTFEDFVKQVESTPAIQLDTIPLESITISLSDSPVTISSADHKMYSRHFQILHDDIGLDKNSDTTKARRDYLEGRTNPWIGIARGWAFRRHICDRVRSEVLTCLRAHREQEVKVVLIHGPAGSGKSTIARLISSEIYRNEGFPVIFLAPESDQIDYALIDSFARQLEEYSGASDQTKRKYTLLVVIDEAAAHIQDVRRLPQYLASRGIASAILAIARTNEWKLALGDSKLKIASEIPISDVVDEATGEAYHIVRHLKQLGVLVSAHDNDHWVRSIEHECEGSFATALYFLAEPFRPPLNASIKNEYDRLKPLARQSYRYVSVFYRFGVPLDLELLARSLGCSYEEFVASVYDPASVGVIVEDPTELREIRFRARSRLVAERVVTSEYGQSTDWLRDVCKVVGSSLPHNSNEVQTVRSMLIHRIGPRGAEPQDMNLVKDVFRAAFKAGIRDSATYHHFALLLLDQELFNEATEYALAAIDTLDDDSARTHFRTESRQHLHNTLGVICAKQGHVLESRGNVDAALEQFEKAVGFFRSARVGEFVNAYPFYCESTMHFQRARSSRGVISLRHVASAFQIVDEAIGNVAEDDMASILEMEARLVRLLSDTPELDKMIETLVEAGDSVGMYLSARKTALRDDSPYSLSAALDIVSRALSSSPQHIPSLRLASQLHHKVCPNDFEGWKKLLDRRYRLEDRHGQCSLLFELGYAACQLGNYNEAAGYFEELEAESLGHPLRSRIVEIVKDGEEVRKFAGKVTMLTSRNEGWLKSEVIDFQVKFRPIQQRFTVTRGQSVTFHLGLNYRGYYAIDLHTE